MSTLSLRGITWNHSRALPPLVASAQRFEELHPGVRIQWEKRSLDAFGHQDIVSLAEDFDLLVIDHPMLGRAEAANALVDLLPLLSDSDLQDLVADALGQCLESYRFGGKLYALPIDAAAPAASFRPDLLDRLDRPAPQTWNELLSLARLGCVCMPGFPADLFLNFMALCVSRGSQVAANPDSLFDREIALRCLTDLGELAASMPDVIYSMNPIAMYEHMAAQDDIAYCPFAYSYSNYSRDGFAAHRLRFSNPVSLASDVSLRTILGGTGVAISAHSKNVSPALEYALFVAGATCQRTLYGLSGGQPARRTAWEDALLNEVTDDFFKRTLGSLEAAYVRPRYDGYVGLQAQGGVPLQEYCRHRGNPRQVLDQLDGLYWASLKSGSKKGPNYV